MQEAGRMGAAMKSKRLAYLPGPLLGGRGGRGRPGKLRAAGVRRKAGLVGVWREHRTTDKSLDQWIVKGSAGRPPNRLAQSRT